MPRRGLSYMAGDRPHVTIIVEYQPHPDPPHPQIVQVYEIPRAELWQVQIEEMPEDHFPPDYSSDWTGPRSPRDRLRINVVGPPNGFRMQHIPDLGRYLREDQ